jgi:tyrosinase
MAKPLTPPPLSTAALDTDFTRADIELVGVDHSGSSYEGRIYVNNPDADETTERSPEAGYVGSYHIFGHGGCLGDPGHCDVEPRDPYDPRPGHPLTRARKVVIASEVLREALAGDEVTITIVPVVRSVGPKSGWDDEIVKLDAVRIVTYRWGELPPIRS